MQNGVDECASKQELQELTENVTALTANVNLFVTYLGGHITNLTEMAAGKIPDNCVPVETHRAVIKGLIWAFCVTLVVAIGAIQLLPILVK